MNRVSFSKHFLYWILPSAVTLVCIFIFFFDFFGLSQFIAPELNREFGVVENLQLILLLVVCFTAYKGIRSSTNKNARRVFRVITAMSVFMFLEEIDYGLHYVDYLNLNAEQAATTMYIDYDNEIRNLHNNGKGQNISKLIAYSLVIICFVIAPLTSSKIKDRSPVVKYLSPSLLIITTAISILIVNNIALYLYQHSEYTNQALKGNVSEFEEIMIYYIFLLYIAELVRSRNVSFLFDYYMLKKESQNKKVRIRYTGSVG
jgi:hypothetical protein